MSTPNSPQNSEETVTFPKETTGRTSQISGICSEKSGKASERNDIPVLEVRDLCHRYPHLDSNTLDKINLKVFKGERVAVLGANGAGKSTLFKHLNGILKPLSGEVLIKGEKK